MPQNQPFPKKTVSRSNTVWLQWKPKYTVIAIAATVLLCLGIAAMVFGIRAMQPRNELAVYLNGTHIGYVESEESLVTAQDAVKEEYLASLGDNSGLVFDLRCLTVSYVGRIDYLSVDDLASHCRAAAEHQTATGILLTVNGKKTAFCADMQTVERVLARILDERIAALSAAQPYQAEFSCDIQTEEATLYASYLSDELELYEILTGRPQSDPILRGEVDSMTSPESQKPLPGLSPLLYQISDSVLSSSAHFTNVAPQMPSDGYVPADLQCYFYTELTVEEPVTLPTVFVYDETRYPFYQKELFAGSEGLSRFTYRVKYDANGKELGREAMHVEELVPAVASIIKVGSCYSEPGVATGTFIRPVNYQYFGAHITSYFREYREQIDGFTGHYGIDIYGDDGITPIYASDGGKITFAGWHNSYGNLIIIDHGNGYVTKYAHMHSFADGMAEGVLISQGQEIGKMGNTGNSTGPHLHFEMLRYGTLIDPLSRLRWRPEQY